MVILYKTIPKDYIIYVRRLFLPIRLTMPPILASRFLSKAAGSSRWLKYVFHSSVRCVKLYVPLSLFTSNVTMCAPFLFPEVFTQSDSPFVSGLVSIA